MLSQIRHFQKGALIALTIIIVTSFAFLYSDFDFVGGTLGRQDCAVKVYNRCYRVKEFRKLASHFDVALELGMYDFATVLFGERRMDRDPTDFAMSLVVLRKEAERLGIEPSDAEIKAAIPKLPVFQQPWVNAAHIENNILGPNGFTQSDLAQLVKDYLCFQRLRELVTAGVEATPAEAERRYIQASQIYTASVVRFERSEFAKTVEITDADIKKYYDDNQDTLKSEAKRTFGYVKFTPKPQPADATNEAKAKSNLDFANSVNRAYADLADDKADFAAVGKQYSGDQAHFIAEAGTLAPFAPSDVPEFLKGNDTALSELFSGAYQVGEVSVPIGVDGGAYYVFRFSEDVAPVPLTLEEATPAIREALLATRSNQKTSDAAGEALAKLSEAVKGGKPFAEAAKALNLTTEALPVFSKTEPPADVADASIILGAIDGLSAKEISPVTARPGGAGYLLVYVDKIEIYKDPEAESKQKMITASIKNQLDRTLFSAWFNQRKAESGALRPEAPIALQ
ncbi:MAG TPA: peptidyl-prolyl cis-trans isomerase [Bacteroidia bacterium]|nr:peptidyl-prolyl cis-trans isomerase [Bacteroidia bacterium]